MALPLQAWSKAAVDFNHDGKSDILWQNIIDGHPVVWYLNGTNEIGGGPITAPGSTVALVPGTTWKIVGTGDFKGDGTLGILWQNTTDGHAAIWFVNDTTVTSSGQITAPGSTVALVPGTSWKIVGTADFDGDGKTDILWQNTTDGHAAIWYMNGTTAIKSGAITKPGSTEPVVPGTSWKLVGTGDFDGDGKIDLLWQNADGHAVIWYLNGTNQIGGGPITTAGSSAALEPGTSWKIVGTADFDGDGKTDILWQNTNDGHAAIWYLNGTTAIKSGAITKPGSTVPVVPGTSWKLVGTGDFDGDGKIDLLWQNADGHGVIWYLNGTNQIGGGPITQAGSAVAIEPGTNWLMMPQTPVVNPEGLTINALGDTSITISWSPGGPFTAGYVVNLGSSCLGGAAVTSPSYTFSGLSPNVNYTFSVCAANFTGTHSFPITGSATTYAASRPCGVANGSGVQYWSGGGFGVCQVTACNSGYVVSGNSCALPPPPPPPPPPTNQSCNFNGQTVASGSSITGYASSSVGYGSSCQSASLVCQNGNLQNASSYPANSCTVSFNFGSNIYWSYGTGPSSQYYWNNGTSVGSNFYWTYGTGVGSKYYWNYGTGVGSNYYWNWGTGPGSQYYWNNQIGVGSNWYFKNGTSPGSNFYFNYGSGPGSNYYWNNGYNSPPTDSMDILMAVCNSDMTQTTDPQTGVVTTTYPMDMCEIFPQLPLQ